jgi:sulfate transport system ATP-binding protein
MSGGQQQRVALARALVNRPKVLLLDEPLGALDAKLRKEMQIELKTLQREVGITFIFVTHDQEEALEVADQVVLMNKGRVEQLGTPDAVYNQPASPFVYGFLGNVNLFHGRVNDGVLASGDATFHAPQYAGVQNGEGIAYVRPHDLDVARFVPGGEGVPVKLRRAHAIGPLAQLDLERADNAQLIEAVIPNEQFRSLNLREGDTLLVKPRRVHVFVDQDLVEQGGGI